MDTVILVEGSLQCDSLEKKRHKRKLIFFCNTRKYSFIRRPVVSPEIERSTHPSKEDRDIFRLYFLDDRAEIGLDITDRLSLESVVGTDTKDHERWSISLENPVKTREESCSRISWYSRIDKPVVIPIFSEFFLELTRIWVTLRESISSSQRVSECEYSFWRFWHFRAEFCWFGGSTWCEKKNGKKEEVFFHKKCRESLCSIERISKISRKNVSKKNLSYYLVIEVLLFTLTKKYDITGYMSVCEASVESSWRVSREVWHMTRSE